MSIESEIKKLTVSLEKFHETMEKLCSTIENAIDIEIAVEGGERVEPTEVDEGSSIMGVDTTEDDKLGKFDSKTLEEVQKLAKLKIAEGVDKQSLKDMLNDDFKVSSLSELKPSSRDIFYARVSKM